MRIFLVGLFAAVVGFAASFGLLRMQHEERPPAPAPAPVSEDSFFNNDIVSDETSEGRTVEAMVKRCESAEMLLKAAGGQIMPALQPMSNDEAAKRLVEIGACVGSLGTFSKVKFPGRVCMPTRQHLTPVQAIRVFLQWAQNHPAKLEENYMVGYLEAYEDAFPCPVTITH